MERLKKLFKDDYLRYYPLIGLVRRSKYALTAGVEYSTRCDCRSVYNSDITYTLASSDVEPENDDLFMAHCAQFFTREIRKEIKSYVTGLKGKVYRGEV